MATINYDSNTNPIPEKMYRDLRKAHDFVIKVIDQMNEEMIIADELGQPRQSEEAQQKRFQGAVNYYAKVAAQYENAPSYYQMVRYVIYGWTDVEAGNVD